jgi:acylpyruvate hydrolase
MIWTIPRLIAYFSQMTLEPGDVITTGTPGGTAMARTADRPSWFLKSGDLLESEVEGIGTLRNHIVDDRSPSGGWAW